MEVYFSSGELVQVTGLEMVEFRCREFSAMAGSALWQDRPRPSYTFRWFISLKTSDVFPLQTCFLKLPLGLSPLKPNVDQSPDHSNDRQPYKDSDNAAC